LKADPEEEGAVHLNPNSPEWGRALGKLEMGAAHRIVLRFDEAWWIKPHRPAPVFLHGDNELFPVWWTSTPSQLPFITGWAGGRRARLLSGKTIDQLVPMALRSVSSILGSPVETVAARVRAAYSYDWTADPYARGAYSYGGVGAAEAREILQRPVEDTIFLAGEALVGEGRNATVPGALTSGFRAAAAVLHPGGDSSQPEE
jgi:monoamine oxidase